MVHTLGAHVVLADPGGVETGLFAEDDFLSEVVEELVVVSVAAGVNAGVEVSEFHVTSSIVAGLWGLVWGEYSRGGQTVCLQFIGEVVFIELLDFVGVLGDDADIVIHHQLCEFRAVY